MKKRFKKLSHTIWYCKYHIVWCPKYRYRIFQDEIADYTKQLLLSLSRQKDLVKFEELNIQSDHVHSVLSIAPKYTVSGIMGFFKGKSAIELFKRYEILGKRYWGRHLWSRGYCASTIGLDEDRIKAYVKYQEEKEKEAEQLGLSFTD